nr:glycosyltransferase family 2 protein [Brevibacillus humidisoli]
MPAYNRSLPLMLTLASFETQCYPRDKFEIIVVNDGSTDDTQERLMQYEAPYRLVTITTNQKNGRAAARNIGVAAARSPYVIFCDCDFLVTPQFLTVHSQYHKKSPNSVISAAPQCWKSVYTHLYPDFSDQEKDTIRQLLNSCGLWDDPYWDANTSVEMVTPDDIRQNTDILEKIAAPWDVADRIKREYLKTDVAPWLLSATRCLSMPKKLFHKANGFDPHFDQYDLEDWELGYRLHKHGYRFVSIDKVIGYRQEHPASSGVDANLEHLRKVYRLHGFHDPELSLFAVCPPWEKINTYKNMLRILNKFSRYKRPSYQRMAKSMKQLFAHTAAEFNSNPHSPWYHYLSRTLGSACIEAEKFLLQKSTKYRYRGILVIMRKTYQNIQSLAPNRD